MNPEAKPAAHVRVLTYEQALAAARRAFVRESRLDMQALARELSVGRATLYRVAHSRDRLLGDVIWSFGEQTLKLAQRETRRKKGIERIVEMAKRFNRYVVDFEPLRTFLRTEPMTAFRVLFTPAGDVHQRFVKAWKVIFVAAAEAGEFKLPYDADDLAYIFVRIGESMLYSDLLAGREPDIELAAMLERALLKAR